MSTLKIGDEVTLPQGHRAVLKWIGHIPGRQPTEFAGVEVLGPEAELHGKHSGVYQGQQIFHTSRPHTGLFVSYTQLLSCNIRAPRYSPVQVRGGAAGAESSYFGSPSRVRNGTRASSPTKDSGPGKDLHREGAGSAAGDHHGPVPGDEPAAMGLNPKQIQTQRQFFREAMAAATTKLGELSQAFATKTEALRADFDEQVRLARRSSAIYPTGSEVEEQRLALAAMQNKLINERSEKQEEIDKLKAELSHMRKLAGSVEDLESLIAELENSERQLAQLRSQVNDRDALKAQLAEALQHNVELELAVQAAKSREGARISSPDRKNMVAREEHERLEKLLESKLLRESELEAENEALQQKVAELEGRSAPSPAKVGANARPNGLGIHQTGHTRQDPNQPDLDRHAKTQGKPDLVPGPADLSSASPNQRDLSMIDAVPVPDKLVSYDDSMDVAAGRSDWCSLCERQGHVTTECPF